MEAIYFLGMIILFVLFFSLRNRVHDLERKIRKMGSEPAPVHEQERVTPDSLSLQQRVGESTARVMEKVSEVTHSEKNPFSRFTDWLKEEWLLKLGALLLIIGFGWLVTYAFLNDIIGPTGRIVFGLIAGVLILLLGWVRIQKFIHQGGIFIVLGSTVVLVTIFAARSLYDMFTPATGLLVMFLSIVFVALASVKYRSATMSLASLILAGGAPLLTNSDLGNYIGLFSYLFVVVLGMIWIVAITKRRELITASLLMVVFYSLPYLLSHRLADYGALLLFVYAFTTLFFISHTISLLKSEGKAMGADLFTAFANGLFLLAWILIGVNNEWQSIFIAAWMIVFSVGAFVIYKVTNKKEPFYVYTSVVLIMLATATAVELNGAALTIAYTIESLAISVVAYLMTRDLEGSEKLGWLMVGPMFLSFISLENYNYSIYVFDRDFWVLFILGLALLLVGLFFSAAWKKSEKHKSSITNVTTIIVGTIYFYLLIWLVLHKINLSDDIASMVALVIYTVCGLGAYFYGRTHDHKATRFYGAGLLMFVVIRLLFVEVAQMELFGKIITFFVIGILLMSTAFLGRKKTVKLNDNPQ